MAGKLIRARLIIFILLSIVTVATIFFFKAQLSLYNYSPKDRAGLLRHIKGLINSGRGKTASEGQACRVPVLEVNSTEILRLLKKVPKVICNSQKDWVDVEGSTVKISNWAKKKYGDIECSFTEIIRQSDYEQHQGMTTTTHTEYNLEASDVVRVNCISQSGRRWNKVIMGIRSDQDIFDRASWFKVPKDSLRLNVVMFGFDSLSHNMWKRLLPKTYKYVVKDLRGIALNGYNIVGDGTPQALIPILTGRTELELPDTRKRMGKDAQYVNVYPFIWNDFQRNGYVTGFAEDMIQINTFTYRLKGFQEQPVDHYMRTFFVEASPNFSSYKPFCYGGMTRFQVVSLIRPYKLMIDFVRNMYEVYKDKPKFMFTFHNEYTHDNNNGAWNADEEVYQWLQEFQAKGYLNNTLLILMSDHGSRFADIRNTQQGKQEERLPAFIFVFPPWFEKKYPEAISNFKTNIDRLSTPFDVHATLLDVLHFKGAGKGSTIHRGISLFNEIPIERTCQHASIEPHWCSCLDWETVSPTAPVVVGATEHLVKFINSQTAEYRDLCLELKLNKILWSARLLPNEYILKFKKNYDYDGFLGDMSDSTQITVETYEVKVSLSPGYMLYEASIRYLKKEGRYSVSLSDISRINKYQHMTHCIEDWDVLHHLRKYCHCH